MNWTPVDVRLGDLKPWERNPKTISKAHAKRLLELWERLGQFQTIAIGPGGEVYDGHQRLNVLKAAHGNGYAVQALQAERALTEAEREELTIAAHVGTTGQFDWDALSGWDAGNLQQWGFDAETLKSWQADAGNLRTMLNVDGDPVDMKQLWRGMPEFEQEDVFGAIVTIKVHIATHKAMQEFAHLVGQTVNENTKFIWYPKQERENLKRYQVIDES